jgi:hypothetical protein
MECESKTRYDRIKKLNYLESLIGGLVATVTFDGNSEGEGPRPESSLILFGEAGRCTSIFGRRK